MQLPTFMNYGRWIMNCPRCNTALPALEAGVICPRCFPDITAKAWRPLKNGDLRPVPDHELIAAATTQAREQDEIYFPLYPREKEQIERILRMRPAVKNMNWIPEESLDDLRQQNIDHGDPVPAKE